MDEASGKDRESSAALDATSSAGGQAPENASASPEREGSAASGSRRGPARGDGEDELSLLASTSC